MKNKAKQHYPNLYDICDKEPSGMKLPFKYVWLNKKVIFASDAHIFVEHKTEQIFNPEFAYQLPDFRIGVHWMHAREMMRVGARLHIFREDQKLIEYIYKGVKNIIPIETEESVGTFPDYEAIFPEGKLSPVKEIAFNPFLLMRLYKAFDMPYGGFKMEFRDANKPIVIKVNGSSMHGYDFRDSRSILMPIMISE